MTDKKHLINTDTTSLGIEFGSTRIKAVLIDQSGSVLASGEHAWKSRFEEGVFTYSLEDIWTGLRDCYKDLKNNVRKMYDLTLTTIGSIGISGMMHGYMVFDKDDQLLVPFRTWQNTSTQEASSILTNAFAYKIPQRWSIAHLYQAILNEEEHISRIHFQTTLAGYIHWQLTGEKVLGVGEASGMFPIDLQTKTYQEKQLDCFASLTKDLKLPWSLIDILPKVQLAGEVAGVLQKDAVTRLDEDGDLQAGIPFCPPEGDAGTGMVATNAIAPRSGNVSAGTSVFSMVVLEKELSKVYEELDIVTTPLGDLVAMVHVNNCTVDINAWVSLFREFSQLFNMKISDNELYTELFNIALKADASQGGLLSYNYVSGEHISEVANGVPLFLRTSSEHFTLANFMCTHIYSAISVLKIGMDILLKDEKVKLDNLLGHGGFFKTKAVGQKIMAAAMHTDVSCMHTAAEGGAWGIALLASFIKQDISLSEYLDTIVFKDVTVDTEAVDETLSRNFENYIDRYKQGLPIEKLASEVLR